jgi:peptide-methionine (R)-S-oxide reductase
MFGILESERKMKVKLMIGVTGVVLVSVFAGKFGQASAEYTDSAAPIPTPAAVEKRREVVLLDAWDGVKLQKSDAFWKSDLTEFEYYVLRKEGTETAYTGELTDNKAKGTYYCNACGLAVFSSKHKYDSQTGWPSFYQPISTKHVGEKVDRSIPEEIRTEVHCKRCGGHLGHVFDDGPQPTGLRYCINSVSLRFKAAPK